MVLRRLATPLFLYIMMHTEELGRLISLGRTYLLVVSQIQNYSLRSIVIHILKKKPAYMTMQDHVEGV